VSLVHARSLSYRFLICLTSLIFLLGLFLYVHLLYVHPVAASPSMVLQGDTVSVRYDEGQGAAAQEVLRLHGMAQAGLQRLIPWPISFHTTYVLVKDDGPEGSLEQMAGTRRFVALAIPAQNLVLLDLSKMARHAFVFETTIKHELCHLLLHSHIHENLLPRWLDEGVCQWASNGMAEIIMEEKTSSLEEAVLARKFLPLESLAGRFPAEDRLLSLAYAESESVVKYIEREYGTEKFLTLLNALREGKPVSSGSQEVFGITLAELEEGWKRSLAIEHTWLTYFSIHIYEILFFAAALLAVTGCVKLIVRRKRRRQEEDDNDFGR
jgi:hypothetical protein